MKRAIIGFLFGVFLVVGFLGVVQYTLADEYGLDKTAAAAGLNKFNDVSTIVGNVVGSALSMISVIFFVLMVYGGILWMTARGADEQSKKALDTIFAAIIGIIIVMAAYAITSFIFKSVGGGGGGGGNGDGGDGGTGDAVICCEILDLTGGGSADYQIVETIEECTNFCMDGLNPNGKMCDYKEDVQACNEGIFSDDYEEPEQCEEDQNCIDLYGENYICYEGTCKLKAGGSCDSDADCEGMYCLKPNQGSQESEKVCTTGHGTGEYCTSDNHCIELTTYCSDSKICTERTKGDVCISNDQCPSGVCAGGECVDGMTNNCQDEGDSACKSGYVCIYNYLGDNHCGPEKSLSNGSKCEQNNECQSNLCTCYDGDSWGYCQTSANDC